MNNKGWWIGPVMCSCSVISLFTNGLWISGFAGGLGLFWSFESIVRYVVYKKYGEKK